MTRTRKMRRRWKVATVAGVVALTASTVSFAYFTSAGSGGGAGAVGQAADLTISPATPTSELYPGGTSDVALTISNPNALPIRVNSLELAPGGITAGNSCDTSALHYTVQTNPPDGWTVGARVGAVDGTLTLHLADALATDVDAADDCQGTTFTVYLRPGA